MRNRIIAIIGGLLFTVGMFIAVAPAAQASYGKNGTICADVKTPLHRAFAVWMVRNPDLVTSGQYVEPTTYCTNVMMPGWWIEWFEVDPNKTCISQWGHKYYGGANGRRFTWHGTDQSILRLRCNYTSASGYG